MNTVATIFPHALTFEQILDLPRQFTSAESFPTLVRISRATQPEHWTIPLNDKYPTRQQQWQAKYSLNLESVDQRMVFVFLKDYFIVDGWLSLDRFLNGDADWQKQRDMYRALCREVAGRLGVARVLHTGFSAVPWSTLESQGLDLEGLVDVITPQCGCVIDDFETFTLFPSTENPL